MNHIRYDAVVIYKEYIDGAFAREIRERIPTFYSDENKRGIGRVYSNLLYGKPFRRLTHIDKKHIGEYLRVNKVDVIHYHYGTDAGMFVGATTSTKLPSIVSFYGYDCSSFPRWYLGLGRRYLQQVFDKVDCCLAMSEDMKADLVRVGCPPDKILVHYYGTDVQQFNTKREHNDKDEIVFLSVGYLVPQKGHAFTLRALRKALRITGRKIKLRIVGEGYLEPDLKGYVAKNGLMGHVDFIGSLKHLSREFFEEYRKADVFIHPSVTSETNEKEGIPGAVVEAMASGLPVISTFHAGIPYVIRNYETGLLVNEWDIDRLAECIVELAEDAKLRRKIGVQAQSYAMKYLDLKQKQKELEHIYDAVIEKHKRK